ncbi:MAG TPA: FecR domain-containing protein [Asticcacaulis sp.]|nr:FecR domain-containing protein [Asticcacaulis sp.]
MPKPTPDIHEQAATWVVRLNSDQVIGSEHDAFRSWLEADPAHAIAYAEHVALFAGLKSLSDDDEARDVLLPAPPAMPPLNRRNLLIGGTGLAASAVVATGLITSLMDKTFKTEPGEQKHVRLSDGSSIVVNTDSKLRVHFETHERRIFLDRGQAFFQVAKDKLRPFRVFVGSDEVRALGTAFDVRRIGDRAHVTLEEGRVAIYSAGGAQVVRPVTLQAAVRPVVVLEPGERAVLSRSAPVRIEKANLESVGAWRYGRLILDSTPLGDTVADLNRYGGPQIVLSDPTLADIKISGVFHTGDPVTFADAVTRALPVRIAYQDANKIVLARP